ncbi:hypothetical protein V8F06_012960 [Rhypophila decipiens]
MRGLWNVPAQMANQHGIGMVIWSVLVLVALSYPVGLISSVAWRSSTTTSWPGTRTLAAATPPSATPSSNIFRVSSDVLVLFGVFRLAIRFTQSSRFPVAISHSITAAEYWAGFLLWVLTLTRSIIFFVLSFCWLSAIVNVSAIDTLARVCYALDAGYTAIQFVGVAGGMSLALGLWMGFVAPGRFKPICYDEGAGMELPLRELLSLLVRGRELPPWKALNLLALPCLLGRSFCEVVIAGTLSRADVVDIPDITLARHITHGAFTVGLFWALYLALPTERAQIDKWVDEAHADVRSRLTGLINERTQQGKLGAPDMKDLLDEMKNDPLFGRRTSRGTGAGQGSGAQQAMASREVEETAKTAAERYYLGVLRKQFTKWTPIQRWDTGGAAGVDVFAIPTGWTRANHNIE